MRVVMICSGHFYLVGGVFGKAGGENNWFRLHGDSLQTNASWCQWLSSEHMRSLNSIIMGDSSKESTLDYEWYQAGFCRRSGNLDEAIPQGGRDEVFHPHAK